PTLSSTHQCVVLLESARCGLRFPAHAAADFRRGASREEQRRDLPRDDEEVSGCRLPGRRGAGSPLSPRARQVAVLQLPAHLAHCDRRVEVVVGARHPARAPESTNRHQLAGCRETAVGVTSPGDNRSSAVAEFYRGRRVMVTGGLGFIGSHLAHRLAALDADVLLVDSLIPDYGGNLFNIDGIEDRVRVNVADVRQASTMNYLVRDREVIFNLAGQVSHIDSLRDPHTDLEINCRSQLTLLEACRHHNPKAKVVYASTRQIYGRPDHLPVTEQHLVR